MRIDRLIALEIWARRIGVIIVACIVYAILTGCASVPHRAGAARWHRDQQAASAVKLEVECTDGPKGSEFDWTNPATGSGVIVTDRHVLTAAHVVRCPAIATVRATLFDGRRLRMSVVREDRTHDLALLELSSAGRLGVPVPPAARRAQIGAPVCSVVSAPAKAPPEWNCGHVAARRGFDRGDLELDVRTECGNSGAPVYDLAGYLIGVVVSQPDPSGKRECRVTETGFATSIADRPEMMP